MRDTAVILTAYNRPTLVNDAIASVLEQDCDRWRLYIMDDGCNDATRGAIAAALGDWRDASSEFEPGGGIVHHRDDAVWWQGPQRSMDDRRATIPYSVTICHALNHLIQDEKYILYLCDDDVMYPEGVRVRAEYLDAHPDVHVCYGRSRSVQFDNGGFNAWTSPAHPKAGRHSPHPTGQRELIHENAAAITHFENGEVDGETGLPYVEEAVWHPGAVEYGNPFRMDHNQVAHRRECLTHCRDWPGDAKLGGKMFWGESVTQWSVGDAAFFTLLGEIPNHGFWGVPEWVVSKKFHKKSWGTPDTELRE